MANGNGPLNPASWVEASKAIMQLGFSVVVAGVLLWYLLFRFQHNLELITERMQGNAEMARLLVESERTTQAELHAQTVELQSQTALMKQFLELRQRQPQPPP